MEDKKEDDKVVPDTSPEVESEEYAEIANKVRSGEYFRDARLMVDIDVHDPMTDRYWDISLSIGFFIIAFIAISAWQGFFPLNPRVSFIYLTNNEVDDYAHIETLVDYHGEDPNVALRRHLAKHYVKVREEYDAELFDRSHNAVQSLSSKEVLDEYEKEVDPTNPNSPVALYQRSVQRGIKILSTQILNRSNAEKETQTYSMRVTYEAVLKIGETKKPPTEYQVDIAFQYKDIKLDPVIRRIEPYGFIVTAYHTK